MASRNEFSLIGAVDRLPLILHEDDDLLVIDKPAGWNTHAPERFAGEGVYDWLRHREPRWAGLAILHRLDKGTSGVMVFGKTPRANRSLAEQFEQRRVRKTYRFLSACPVPQQELVVRSQLMRQGDRWGSVPGGRGESAETRFRATAGEGGWFGVEAEPITGRTHQIRVHAAEAGFAVLGDSLYGGAGHGRVCLHATQIAFHHPASGQSVCFRSQPEFGTGPASALRRAIIDPALTDAYRWRHGAADGESGWFVDRLGDWFLSQSAEPLSIERRRALETWLEQSGGRGAWHKLMAREVRRLAGEAAAPQPVSGLTSTDPFLVAENGLRFELGFAHGYSVGLFLDQRDNRRRLLRNHVGADFGAPLPVDRPSSVLNLFAYTCGFSVGAARAGARTTSLDLSRNYLAWGRRNFAHNRLDPEAHEFFAGDAFDWLRRFRRKQRRFDLVILDPPTFSTTKNGGRFRAETDYARLVAAAEPVVASGGTLLACTNAANVLPEVFCAIVEQALRAQGRRVTGRHYAPQPPDFPVSRAQPAYLKTLWLRID